MKILNLRKTILSLGIDEKWQQFLEYLQFKECPESFKINKITIHIETGNLILDNVNNNKTKKLRLRLH